MTAHLDIVIASYGRADDHCGDLAFCLDTVAAFTDVPHRVIVERSMASAAANRNSGLRKLSARYVCFLDDDAWVTPKWASRLISSLEMVGGRRAAVAPKLKLESGRIFALGMQFNAFNQTISPCNYGQRDRSEFDALVSTFLLPTTCLLMETSLVATLGYFDEGYRTSQWEDADYLLRAHQLGIGFYVAGEVVVYHRHLYRTKDADENEAYFYKRWGNYLEGLST